ncbi:MAG: hypothetical protein Alpg2KO_17220 [Alphaproteobacteria bacterium]
MSFGNWLKEVLHADAKQGPEQSPKQGPDAAVQTADQPVEEAQPAYRPLPDDHYEVEGQPGAMRVRNWDEYVSFAVEHIKQGGSISPLARQHTDKFLHSYDRPFRDSGPRFEDDELSDFSFENPMVPGVPVGFELYDHMLEEICLQLRGDGIRFPRHQITQRHHAGFPRSREDWMDRERKTHFDQPLIEFIDEAEATLDRHAERLGEDQMKDIADMFWHKPAGTYKDPIENPRIRKAKVEDFMAFLVEHIEAGGKIGVSEGDHPSELDNHNFSSFQHRAAMRRMGRDMHGYGSVVAEADGWLDPAYGSSSVTVICKPGVDFDSPGGRTLIPGQDRSVDVPSGMVADLHKRLADKGITLTDAHIETDMDPAIRNQLMSQRPVPPEQGPHPLPAPGP